MTCHELELRLYDEDCRTALLGEQAAPPDVAMHLAACGACRASWAAAAQESQAIHGALSEPLPTALRAALYRIPLEPRASGWMARVPRAASALAVGALVTIATSLVFSTAPTWQLATFAVVVMLTTVLGQAREAGLHLAARSLLRTAWPLPRHPQ